MGHDTEGIQTAAGLCFMRDELLNEHLFDSLRHARNLVAAWQDDFNHHRPHSSLADMTPLEYVNRSKEGQNLNRANS